MEWILGSFIFIFGAITGSFLNVCISRLPKEQSIVKPRSHCTHCNRSIHWYDNIPLFSFIVLRGKCRACKTKISPRYFFVELLTALTWLFLWIRFDQSAFFYSGIVLFSILIAVFFTDLETGYIPDALSLPGIVVGIIFSTVMPQIHGETSALVGLRDSLIGTLAGGGVLYVIGLLGNLIFKKESMGGGDVKLLAMLGAFLGPQKALMVFMFSPFPALPFALYMKMKKKAETIPYGPFLAISGALFYLYGDWIVRQLFYY